MCSCHQQQERVASTNTLSDQPISAVTNHQQARPPSVGPVRARLVRSRRGQDHPTCTCLPCLTLIQVCKPSTPSFSSVQSSPVQPFPLASPRQGEWPRLDSSTRIIYPGSFPPGFRLLPFSRPYFFVFVRASSVRDAPSLLPIMARVYADVNQNMPRSYWDYDGVNISMLILLLRSRSMTRLTKFRQAGVSWRTTRLSARSVCASHPSSATVRFSLSH